MLHKNDTSLAKEKMLPLLQKPILRAMNKYGGEINIGENVLECVGCIVGLTFGELIVANFGAAYEACTFCSCRNLSQEQCTNTIEDALYAVIAAMPVMAVSVFEKCKSLCVN